MKVFQIEISELDEKILSHVLIDPQQWVKDAVINKVANSKERSLIEAQSKLIADPEIDSMPANEESLLNLYFSRPYYMNRAQREAQGEE